MNKFVVCGKEYVAKEVDFNLVVDMQELGFDIAELRKAPKAIRAYFAYCSGMTLEDAGKEISKHFVENGELPNIEEAFSKEIEASDFFRSLVAKAQKETGNE